MRILYVQLHLNGDASKIMGVDLNFKTIFAEDFEPHVLEKSYTPGMNDKLFFLPGVNIPRVKLKNLATTYNIKTVRDITDATHIFAGKATSGKIGETQWYYKIDTIALTNFMQIAKDDIDSYDYSKLLLAAADYDLPYIYCDYNTRRVLLGHDNVLPCITDLKFQQNLLKFQHNDSVRVTAVKNDYDDLYNHISQNTLYNESGLLAHVNGDDAVIIDEIVFDQLQTMLRSSDDDNATLALEIMANCNYSDSLLYLEMLFKECSYNIANCSAKKHVNFRSLLSYLNKDYRYLDTSLDNIVQSLINKKVLTQDKLDILINRYNEELSRHGSTRFFRVKTMTMSTEVLELLNTNYSNQITEDFVPAPVETVEQIELEEEETPAVVTEPIIEESSDFSWF
jgi:hypothetical protein